MSFQIMRASYKVLKSIVHHHLYTSVFFSSSSQWSCHVSFIIFRVCVTRICVWKVWSLMLTSFFHKLNAATVSYSSHQNVEFTPHFIVSVYTFLSQQPSSNCILNCTVPGNCSMDSQLWASHEVTWATTCYWLVWLDPHDFAKHWLQAP